MKISSGVSANALMPSTNANQIRIKYNEVRPLYERLAKALHGILDEDPRFPSGAVYAVKHRTKNEERLIEKIRSLNRDLRVGQTPITQHNLQARIKDLLGFRIICLRLSDLDKLKSYISSLENEDELKVIQGPTEKKSFIIRPGEEKYSDLQYSGYSSIHYVVKAGKNLRMSKELRQLRVELQLRTIFEEAWGELDHKYQYEKTRTGQSVPGHVTTGFRDLGLYMLACARQADHLCEAMEQLAEPFRTVSPRRRKPKTAAPTVPTKLPVMESISSPQKSILSNILRSKLGFTPSERTLVYCERRMREHAFHTKKPFDARDLGGALTGELQTRFRKIYSDVRGKEPFIDTDPSARDIDLVALVNYAIFSTVRSREVSDSGLRAHLLVLESESRSTVHGGPPGAQPEKSDVGAVAQSEQKGDLAPSSVSNVAEVPNPQAKERSGTDGNAKQ